jgi:phosphatidylglycerol:prolipoprotein diacylglycerol transferase
MIRNSKKLSLLSLGFVNLIIFIYGLHLVFIGQIILPQEFVFANFRVRYYGLALALATASAYAIGLYRAKDYGLVHKTAESIMLLAVIGGFIGARLYHVVVEFSLYQNNLWDAFAVWHGGLSIFGAVLGGVLAVFLYNKINKKSLFANLQLLDWLTPGVIVGQIIGRLGNFFNYELYGYPTNLPWKMFVPESFRTQDYLTQQYFHPLFAYEMLINIFIILILWLVSRLHKKYEINSGHGSLFLGYVFLYTSSRFLLEFLRIDSVFIGDLRLNVLVSFALLIFSATVLMFRYYVHISKAASNS